MVTKYDGPKAWVLPPGMREYHFMVCNYAACFVDSADPTRRARVALLSREPNEEGVVRAFSIGGGAHFSLRGKRLLRGSGVHFRNEKGEKHGLRDVRLDTVLPIENENKACARIQEHFIENPSIFKNERRDMFRELAEELGASKLRSGAVNKDGRDILSERDLRSIHIEYVTTLCPRDWGREYTQGGKARSARGMRTRPMYKMFNVTVPTEVFDKLITSEKLHVITEEDAAALRAAALCGEGVARVTRNGRTIELGTNLCLTGD